MFSGLGRRVVALFVAASMLVGCAELDRRGGYVDEIADAVFFKADTKTHRLLRSYLLATVLLTAARRQGHNDVDRTAIAGALEGALAVANEAYICLYPGLYETKDGAKPASYPVEPKNLKSRYGAPSEITNWRRDGSILDAITMEGHDLPRWCQFFDERMSRLDYALFRLASVTLFNSESREALGDIQAKLVGKVPVVSDTVAALIHANKAVNQVTTVIDDLLTLAFRSAAPVLALLPLYRDSLELNMWVVTDNLALACKAQSEATFRAIADKQPYALEGANPSCAWLIDAITALQNGNGNPKVWRDFLKRMNAEVNGELSRILTIEAFRPHFFLVSQLLRRSCLTVLSDAQKPTRCDDVLVDALEKAEFQADNATGNLINTGGAPHYNRRLTASLPLPGANLVHLRGRRTGIVAAAPKPPGALPASDPAATGSINSRPPAAKSAAPVR